MRALEATDLQRNVAFLKGSSGMFLNDDGVGLNYEAIEAYADHVAEVDEEIHPVLVVGGGVGAGRAYLQEMGEDHRGVDPQVLASYGTPRVSMAIQGALRDRGIKSGQIMANHDQAVAGSTLMQAILHGIILEGNVYHINENDQENKYELKLLEQEEKAVAVRKKSLGIDNDPLAAQLTIAFIEELKRAGLDEEIACHLVMFTAIGGMVVKGEVEPEVSATDREAAYSKCNGVREGGSGGMRVKLEACFDAHDAGAKTVHIASPDQNWLRVINDQGEEGKVTKVVQ